MLGSGSTGPNKKVVVSTPGVELLKQKSKKKSMEDILGIPLSTISKRSGAKSKKERKRGRTRKRSSCATLRSIMAAVSLSVSISAEGVANRNRLILDEAQAAWEIGKLLGMEYEGDEDEVVSKMVRMEEQDMEIAGDRGMVATN